MATSHCNPGGESVSLDDVQDAVAAALPGADDDEAAAIAAAVSAHLQAEAHLAITQDSDSSGAESENDRERNWRLAGRVRRLQGRNVEMSSDAPSDPWVASGRADRL
jgi:hypothetical protein